MTVDVSKKSAVTTAATKVLATIGHLDVLINNAGVVVGKTSSNSRKRMFP